MGIALILAPAWIAENPPGNIAKLAAVIKKAGHSVRCFDFNIEFYQLIKSKPGQDKQTFIDQTYWQPGDGMYVWGNREFVKRLIFEYNNEIDNWVNLVISKRPKFVGFTVYSTSLFFCIELAERIKKADPEIITVFGGPECFPHINGKNIFTICNAVDYICFAEGELAILNLFESISKGNKIVNGFYFKSADGIIYQGENSGFISDLNDLPFPDFGDFDLGKYNSRTIPVNTSRGCINRCSFCNDSIYWDKFRVRSSENIFKEIQEVITRYPKTETLWFTDSLINGDMKMLSNLCDLIINGRIKIRWIASAYIRKGMDESFFRKLKESGCSTLIYGLENGSDAVLKSMHKGYNSKLAKSVLKDCVNSGIETFVNIIIGHPGEHHQQFIQTIRFKLFFLNRYNIKTTPINDCKISKGSLLRRKMHLFGLKGGFSNNWSTLDGTNNYYIRDLRLRAIKLLDSYYKKNLYDNSNQKAKIITFIKIYFNTVNIFSFIYFEIILRIITSVIILTNKMERLSLLFNYIKFYSINKQAIKILGKKNYHLRERCKIKVIAARLTQYKIIDKKINSFEESKLRFFYEQKLESVIAQYNPVKPAELIDAFYYWAAEPIVDKFDSLQTELLVSMLKAELSCE